MNLSRLLVASLMFVASVGTGLADDLPVGSAIAKLEAAPASITLKHPYDYRQLTITATLKTGEALDATRMAPIGAPAFAKVSAGGLVRPVGDGSGEITFSLGGQAVRVPIAVSGQKDKYQVSFIRDVMPMMSKLGCNAGTCHGAADGKAGFKLSLRGYDALHDYRALTDDLESRRFNRAAPDRSLMLLKPAGGVPHVGGVLMQPGEPSYELLRAWIGQGVQFDAKALRVAKVEVAPIGPILPLPGMKQQLSVLATYSDGAVRDVTAEAFVDSSNTEVATVDKTGLVTAVRRGEATMLVRYEGNYAATTLVVMGDRTGFQWVETPTHGKIDELVYEKLKRVKVLPSGLCSDEEFIRRVYLDLTGLPPGPEEVRAFLADVRPTRLKRDELIDRLVGSAEFVEHWTNKWADLLQVNRKFLGDKGASSLRGWIRTAVAKNMPYDEFVATILTAGGSNVENPPASYFKILRDPESAMENTTQLFLAIRFNCNKCHDHPFERWTQDQYYQMASFFAQVGRRPDPVYKGQTIGGSAVEGAVPLVEVIFDNKGGDVKQIRTGEIAKPVFPYDHKDIAAGTLPRRQQVSKWITSKDNAYFARSYVNRLWAYLLGVGLIEPIDDIRAGNPPTNPQLLDYLADEFVRSKFDVHAMIKQICKSRTYQHSIVTSRWNADDEVNYSHALARRLPAEVLFDAIYRAAGATPRLPGLPPGARAAQLIDSNVPIPGGFLELLGKPPRESACECERSSGMALGPVLNMVNGPVVGEALRDPANRISKLVATEKDDRKLVEEIFLAILCRKPSAKEIETGIKAIHAAGEDQKRLLALHQKRLDELKAYETQLPVRQADWETRYGQPTTWETLDVQNLKSQGGAVLTKQKDGSVLASAKNPSPEVYTFSATTKLKGITAVRLEVLSNPALPSKGPGRAPNGNFVLNEFRLAMQKAGDAAKPRPVGLKGAIADFSQDGFPVEHAIDNNPGTGWAISPQIGMPHTAMFRTNTAIGFAEGAVLTFTMDQRFPGNDHNIGAFRVSVTTAREPLLKESLPDAVLKAIAVPLDKRTPEQKAAVANYYRGIDAELRRLQALVAEVPPAADVRLLGAQDLAWALMNSPAFLFNH